MEVTTKVCPMCTRVVPAEDNICLSCCYHWPLNAELVDKIDRNYYGKAGDIETEPVPEAGSTEDATTEAVVEPEPVTETP